MNTSIVDGELRGYSVEGEIRTGSSFKLHKPNGRGTYNIEVREDGRITCECPAFHFRGACKHVAYTITKLGASARIPRSQVEPIVAQILSLIAPHVSKAEPAGSYRRKKATVKDVDIVAIGDPDSVLAALQTLPGEKVMAGENIIRYITGRVQVDIRFTVAESWGATLIFYTGPKELNIAQRAECKARGYKLNEWGLFKRDTEEYIAGATEEDIYRAMGWHYLTPEERERYITEHNLFGGR